MSDTKLPWHFWAVRILALVWNGFGATDYLMTQLENRGWFAFMGMDEATTDVALAWIAAQPAWMSALWALGVWGGLAGALLLLARNRLAVPAFLVSLVGAAGSFVASLQQEVPPELEDFGGGAIMYVVIVLAVFFTWYAWTMRNRGLLH